MGLSLALRGKWELLHPCGRQAVCRKVKSFLLQVHFSRYFGQGGSQKTKAWLQLGPFSSELIKDDFRLTRRAASCTTWYTPNGVVPKRRSDHQMPACGQHSDIPHGLAASHDIALDTPLAGCRVLVNAEDP